MAAGGGRGTGFAFGAFSADRGGPGATGAEDPPERGSAETSFEVGDGEAPTESGLERRRSVQRQGLRINTSFGNDARRAREVAEGRDGDGVETDGEGGSSVAESESVAGSEGFDGAEGEAERGVWAGEVSCVVGLQKRGLRGLMEGRRMRERGKSAGAGAGAGAGVGKGLDGNGDAGGGRVGLGIA